MSETTEKQRSTSAPEVAFEEVTGSGFNIANLDASDVWERSRNVILGVLAGVAIAIGGYFLYGYMMEERQKEAEAAMIGAVRFYEQDSMQKAISGTSQWKGLEALVDEYGSTKAGNQCKIYLGAAYYATGQVDKGLEQFKSYDTDDDMVSAIAFAGIAYGLEEKKQFAEAAENYIKAAKIKENSSTSPDFLMSAARCYEEAGDKAQALKIYRQVLSKYPTSDEGRTVEKYIARLSE